MPKFRIQTPDGKTLVYDVPPGVTAAQALAHAQQTYGAKPTIPVSTRQQGVQEAAKAAVAAKAPSSGGFVNGVENTVGSLYRGIQDQVPLINHIMAGANEAGSALGLNSTPASMSYGDRVRAVQANRDAAMAQDKNNGVAPSIAHYVGEVGGALAGGAGEARVATKLLSPLARAGSVANVIQKAAAVAPKTMRVAKLAAGGAAAGAVAGAGNTSRVADLPGNVGTGAAVGAAAGPVAAGALKVASVLARPIMDLTGASSAASILSRYVKTTGEDLAAKAQAWRARTGANPTVFELLPLEDRQGVQKLLGLAPSASKTQAAKAIQARAANMGPELAQNAHAAIAPQQAQITGQMAQDLAHARAGTGAAPTPDEIALAGRAARSPADMDALRTQEAKTRMAPHDDTVAYPTVDHLVPQAPIMQADGSVRMTETNPDVSNAIRSAAGVQRIDPNGVTIRDMSDMIKSLRSAGTSTIEGRNAAQAADHLSQIMGEDHPDAAAAHQAMVDAYAARSRMMEGFQAGQKGQLRENVQTGTDSDAARTVRNAYDTPEGAAGRTLGQAASLEQQFNQAPRSALRAASDVAQNPTTAEAINRNVGNQAGSTIADAADAQTESANNLAQLNPEGGQGNSMDLPTLAHNLIMLNPASLPATKALAASRIMHAFANLPEKQTTAIVDGLFSQNPTQIASAMKFMNSAGSQGQAALTALGNSMVGGTVAGNAATAPTQTVPDPGAPPLPEQPADPDAPAPAGLPVAPDGQPGQTVEQGISTTTGMPVDPSASPYMPALQKIYDSEGPDFLNYVNRLEHQESRGHQFDPKNPGKPYKSSAGAVGLMQVEPSTAADVAKQNGLPYDENALHYDAAYNKLIGLHYAASLLHKYGGDVTKASAAYNAGPGTVDKATKPDGSLDMSALPTETQNYVPKVVS